MKTVFLGMNNPLSPHPRHALAPYPPGCAGWRLWQAMAARTGISQEQYSGSFALRNLVPQIEWSDAEARRMGASVWRELQGRTVLVLGTAVRNALGLPRTTPPLLWTRTDDVRWCLLPHPSGRNRWWNDPVHRAAAEMRLEEIWHAR